jgi:hypothetical protein
VVSGVRYDVSFRDTFQLEPSDVCARKGDRILGLMSLNVKVDTAQDTCMTAFAFLSLTNAADELPVLCAFVSTHDDPNF